MTEDTKQYIQLHLTMLKQAMKQENLIFGIMVDKKDGITISLEELNRDLL